MRFAWMLAIMVGTSMLQATSAFAVAKMTCEQAGNFLGNDSYTCDDNGTDCSRGECVAIASCRYTKGVQGFTVDFSYPTNCDFEE